MSISTAHIVAIIQARMRSKRLPGKVLADIAGEPMLSRVVERVRSAQTLDQVVVATSDQSDDDRVAQLCIDKETPFFRGDHADVLSRYVEASHAFGAEVIVRLTGDCPLHDPAVIDRTVEAFIGAEPPADYGSNRIIKTYPIGLDVEVVTLAALERAGREADQAYQREHVTPYFYEQPGRFKVVSVQADGEYGSLRWTVDTAEDLEFVRQVYARFQAPWDFGWREVLDLLDREPELLAINAHVRQKTFREAE